MRQLIQDLFAAGWNGQLLQIKEKFGGLRFYIAEGSDEMYNLIDEAEAKSMKTCQICGEPGKTIWHHGWLTTLCEVHQSENN